MPIDPRFFAIQGAVTLGTWAEMAGGVLSGKADKQVTGVAAAGQAGPSDVCYFEGRPADGAQVSDQAAACLVTSEAASHLPSGVVSLICERPKLTHARICAKLFRVKPVFSESGGIAPGAAVHKTAEVSHGAVICDGAAIGEGTRIGPGATIGPGVQIGRKCQIGSHVSIACALLGDHVKLEAGVRIGQAGFGVVAGPEGAEDIPQLGRVILQDHVTIGANSTVDRGAFEDTIIGERTKIDNLCHIGHNVIIGRSVAIAAFGGISGSCSIGDGARLGGRAGVADHVRIGVGASLAAGAGVFRDIPDGETWGGTPAKPLREYMREVAWVGKQIRKRKSQ